jgi:hypothetical protein
MYTPINHDVASQKRDFLEGISSKDHQKRANPKAAARMPKEGSHAGCPKATITKEMENKRILNIMGVSYHKCHIPTKKFVISETVTETETETELKVILQPKPNS